MMVQHMLAGGSNEWAADGVAYGRLAEGGRGCVGAVAAQSWCDVGGSGCYESDARAGGGGVADRNGQAGAGRA